jgi:hypothetical protein
MSVAIPALLPRALLLNEWRAMSRFGTDHNLDSATIEALWIEHGGLVGRQIGLWSRPWVPMLLMAGPRRERHSRFRPKRRAGRRARAELMGDLRSLMMGIWASSFLRCGSWVYRARFGRRIGAGRQ